MKGEKSGPSGHRSHRSRHHPLHRLFLGDVQEV